MNKIKALTIRNVKEIVRDPLSLVFCLAFPLVMLVLFSLIFKNMENVPSMFLIDSYAPGMAVFGFTFTMMFIAMLISGDRTGSFINRILVAPVKPSVFIISYALSAIPITIAQTIIFFLVSLLLGLNISINILGSMLYLVPGALLMISFGMFFGVACKSEKQAGPLCSIIVSAAGMLGGIWMPVQQMSAGFYNFCKVLPFIHAVEMATGAMNGNYSVISPAIFIVLAYTIVFFALATLLYKRKMKA